MGLSLALLAVAGILAGQFQHTVGVAPILAALICAACFLRRRDLLIVGVGAVLIGDLLGVLSWFTLVRVVGILGVIGVIWAIRVRPSLKSLLVALVIVSPVYHLMLAVGDWTLQYCVQAPYTPEGLAASIGMNLPYFQRAFVGELLLTSAFLLVYTLAGYLVSWRWPALLPQRAGS